MSDNDPSTIETQLRRELNTIKDPETGRGLIDQKQLVEVRHDDGTWNVTVGLTSYAAVLKADFQSRVEEVARQVLGGKGDVQVTLAEHERPAAKMGQVGLTAKSVIAVGSGKGGVGKSTVAATLAMALKRAGSKVGLLDTDVYGPSLPTLSGVTGQPAIVENKIEPLDFDGMPVMSIGFLVPPSEAVIWRGPMLHQTVTRFVRDVAWGDLDYLIIDMPPGTGDVAITLSQLLPVTGAIVVCTPQDVALADAIKAVGMFRKVKIPVLGVVENMSGFVCPGCGKHYDIFGKGGAREYAEQEGLPFLGELPINMAIREQGDVGQLAALFENPQVTPYLEGVAYQLVKSLADKAARNPPQPSLPVLS